MADMQNPLPNPSSPTPVAPGAPLIPTPVRPVAPAPAPPPAFIAAPAAPSPVIGPTPPPSPTIGAAPPPEQAISSRFLHNLQSVSAQPFAAPSAAPAAPAPTLGQTSAPAPTTGATPPPPSAVPLESAGLGAQPPGGASAGKPPAPAAAPSFFARFRTLILVGTLALVVLIGLAAWMFLRQPEEVTVAPKARKVELTYWGLWEPAEVMQPLIDKYRQENPAVTVNYIQQRSDQYRQRLQVAIQDGTGPDIFRYHNTWTPMLGTDLAPAARGTLTAAQLRQSYYPIMAKNLTSGQDVIGVPLMYEGLALLYNQSMLEAANAQPPTDWEQVRALASSLTIRTQGRLERGGIALGTTGNVDHFSDILGLMLLQNSAQPGNPVDENAQHALEFYTIFSRVDKVWDDTMPASTVAFAKEQVAMILAPSWRIFEIQRANPNLRFGVAALPRLSGERLAWASYWVEGVSRSSKNATESWKFLAWLSEPEQLRELHSQAASVRGFGELYPRVEMAAELSGNKLVAPYLEDALYADSWLLASSTHDEGVNDQLIQYYADAVNETVVSGNAASALQKILPGIQQVLARYGVSAVHEPPELPGSNTAPAGPVSLVP